MLQSIPLNRKNLETEVFEKSKLRAKANMGRLGFCLWLKVKKTNRLRARARLSRNVRLQEVLPTFKKLLRGLQAYRRLASCLVSRKAA